MGLFVNDDILIFYRKQPALDVHGEHPFVLSHILHLDVAATVPRANGRMAATDGNGLTRLELRSRNAEDDRLAEQRQSGDLHLFATMSVRRGEISVAIEVTRQRTVAPLVWEKVILRGVEVIDARHHIPLLSQHLPVGVLHHIAVDDVRLGMMARGHCHRFQRPQLSVLCLHREILASDGAVLIVKLQRHMQALAPCRAVSDTEFKFHYVKVFCKVTIFLQKSSNFAPNNYI